MAPANARFQRVYSGKTALVSQGYRAGHRQRFASEGASVMMIDRARPADANRGYEFLSPGTLNPAAVLIQQQEAVHGYQEARPHRAHRQEHRRDHCDSRTGAWGQRVRARGAARRSGEARVRAVGRYRASAPRALGARRTERSAAIFASKVPAPPISPSRSRTSMKRLRGSAPRASPCSGIRLSRGPEVPSPHSSTRLRPTGSSRSWSSIRSRRLRANDRAGRALPCIA